MIRNLAPDEIITEPGFYRLPLRRHHDQPCMDPDTRAAVEAGKIPPPVDQTSVTSGILRKMETHTPADVWAFHALNPNAWPKDPPTAAMRQGAAMAALIEGGTEELFKHFRVHDKGRPSRPTEAQIEKIRQGRGTEAGLRSFSYWSKVDEAPEDWIEAGEFELIVEMGGVLAQDEGATAIMGGYPEITAAFRDDRTGLWILSRPDNMTFDGVISDYKKVAAGGRPVSPLLLDRKVDEGAYDMQMALADTAFTALTGETATAIGLVFQSDSRPYHVLPHEIERPDIELGALRNAEQIARFVECLTSGNWPGPQAAMRPYRRREADRVALLERFGMEEQA